MNKIKCEMILENRKCNIKQNSQKNPFEFVSVSIYGLIEFLSYLSVLANTSMEKESKNSDVT